MRSNTGKTTGIPRRGVSSIYYDEFLRHFPGHRFLRRHNEEWNRTDYGLFRGTNDEEWETTEYTEGEIVPEEWDITLYEVVPKVAENWSTTQYSNQIHTQEFWEFTIQYINDSFATQFYEEWEFDTIYVSDSFTYELFEEWEN